MDAQHAMGYIREISRRAVLFLSIDQESYPLRVRDLPAGCAIDTRVLRYPYWLRKGYVEEIYAFGSRRGASPLFPLGDGRYVRRAPPSRMRLTQ
jgi:hypothetical protein